MKPARKGRVTELDGWSMRTLTAQVLRRRNRGPSLRGELARALVRIRQLERERDHWQRVCVALDRRNDALVMESGEMRRRAARAVRTLTQAGCADGEGVG